MLVGRLGRCGQGVCPIFHIMLLLYASGAFALRENIDFLHSTQQDYRKLIKRAKCKPKHEEDTQEIHFAAGQAARKVHACKRTYRIPLSIKDIDDILLRYVIYLLEGFTLQKIRI